MRLLTWFLFTANSVVTALSLSGTEINIYADVSEGVVQAFELSLLPGLLSLTDESLEGAATFILQDGTDYLYVESALYVSGYAIVTLPLGQYGGLGLNTITLVDAATALAFPSLYPPIVCTPQANNGLSCSAGTSFEVGVCVFLGDILVSFSDFFGFLEVCGPSGNYNSLSYSTIGPYPAQGSCSVTVMLYLASSTTYVPAGYVGSSSVQGDGGISSGLPGINCSPVTSTISVSATSPNAPAIS